MRPIKKRTPGFFSEVLTGNIPIGIVIPADQNKTGQKLSRVISLPSGSFVPASYFGGTNPIHQREGNEIIFGGPNTIYPRLGETASHGFFDCELFRQTVHLHSGVRC